MSTHTDTTESAKARQVSLILAQIEDLPTLSSVAMRLLELTSADNSSAKDVIDVISVDAAMTAKVLQLTRRSSLGVTVSNGDLHRAVTLLGFDAVRAAALSVHVFDLLNGLTTRGGEAHQAENIFDRQLFWQHSLSVAVAAEALVRESVLRRRMSEGGAFLCGLLHDLGQIALHAILPRTFDRICELAELLDRSVDAASREILGIDAHTVGKRLAEHWQFPPSIVDVIWKNGEAIDSLPDTLAGDIARLVSLADLIARREHLSPCGQPPRPGRLQELAKALNIPMKTIDAVADGLHREVANRATALGIRTRHPDDLLAASIARAKEVTNRRRAIQRDRDGRRPSIARIVEQFHEALSQATTQAVVVTAVARCMMETLEWRSLSIICRERAVDELVAYAFSDEGLLRHAQTLDAADLLIPDSQDSGHGPGPLHAVARRMSSAHLPHECADPHAMRLIWGGQPIALIVGEPASVERPVRIKRDDLAVLQCMWAAALAEAAEREEAARLNEALMSANRALAEAQDDIAANRTYAALAKIASGAAHEMNNPLMVISGRAQVLQARLGPGESRGMTEEIVRQAHRLSDLITALKIYADRPQPNPSSINVLDLIEDVVREARLRSPHQITLRVSIPEPLPPAYFDVEQVSQALLELVLNAAEAKPNALIEVRALAMPTDDRLMIQVLDEGPGLSDEALQHAFDPFFSEKPAGRQPGLGLSRAQRLITANHGTLSLKNRTDGGAAATILLTRWRGGQQGERGVA